MESKYIYMVRATGILIENRKILIVKQSISNNRAWSLPGGRLESGETLEQAVVREIFEETGVKTQIEKLLYVCESTLLNLLHITFLLKKIDGKIRIPMNEYDENPISDVKMIPIKDLPKYDFSEKFMELVENDFPNSGSYMSSKENIGL